MITNSQAPSESVTDALQRAFDFYNQRLFGGTLPPCILLMHRHRGSYGYFWAERWRSTGDGDGMAHEIAINPDHVHSRPPAEWLSTLVHEMVHMQQEICGEPGRKGYHNREWADLMEKVGLIASTTGNPDGKRTGAKCSHYIESGGRFELATNDLLETGFSLDWGSFVPPATEGKKSGKRAKYMCSGSCGASVWGKEGLSIRCDECNLAMGYGSEDGE